MHALALPTDGYQSPHLPKPEVGIKQFALSSLQERLDQREAQVESIHSLHAMSVEHKRVIRYFAQPKSPALGQLVIAGATTLFDNPAAATKALDAECWSSLMNDAVLIDAMSSKQKKEWDDLVDGHATPEFTAEHVIPTVRHVVDSQGMYFASRVDQVFHGLSPDHITNSPSAFGKRLIIKKLMSKDYTVSSEKSRLVDDLRVSLAITLGRAPLRTSRAMSYTIIDTMRQQGCFGKWISLDGGALRIKLFKVGTLHAELHPDAIYKLNDVLSMLYPHAIPERFRRAPKKASPTFPKPIEDTLPLSVLADLSELRSIRVRAELELRRRYQDHEVIYSFARVELREESQTSALLLALGGTRIDASCWSFDYDVTRSAIPELLRTGVMPNKKSFQYYPSTGSIGEQAATLLRDSMDDDGDILEPSIGQGHLATHFNDNARFVGIEMSSVNVVIARAKGFNVQEHDFLTWAATTPLRFSGVLMNPPFKNVQAAAHVLKAADLLKSSGVLVAIVPAGTQSDLIKTAILTEFPEHTYTQGGVIDNAFDDAAVSVRIIKIERNDDI
jgi:hypothetical protein